MCESRRRASQRQQDEAKEKGEEAKALITREELEEFIEDLIRGEKT